MADDEGMAAKKSLKQRDGFRKEVLHRMT